MQKIKIKKNWLCSQVELDGIFTLPLANLGGLSKLHSVHWCNALEAAHTHKPPTAEMTGRALPRWALKHAACRLTSQG